MLKIENIKKATIEWDAKIEEKIKSVIADNIWLENDTEQAILIKLSDTIDLNFNMSYCTEWTEVEAPDMPEIISRSVYINDLHLYSHDDFDYTEFVNANDIDVKITELFER